MSNSNVVATLSRDEPGVDVAGVPVEELVAVVGGDAPSLFRGRHTQLAVEGQVVGHVHFRGIPERPDSKLKSHLIIIWKCFLFVYKKKHTQVSYTTSV